MNPGPTAARISLFVGKGGVGKSTLATATAVRDARAGMRVLIVSTDQAHSIGDVLGTSIPEGIAVDRDVNQLEVSVVDSRFDPPRIVKQRSVAGKHVRWLRAGVKDGLARKEIGLGTDNAADLLRVWGVAPSFCSSCWS